MNAFMDPRFLDDVELLIWDMDNVLYSYTEEFHLANMEMVAQAACTLIHGMDDKTALRIANQSRIEHKNPFKLFFENYDVTYHALATEAHEKVDISMIEPDEELVAFMRTSNVSHALVTSANKAWTKRILYQTQMSPYFNDGNIVTNEDCPVSKAESCAPYHLILSKVGFKPHQSLMIEDSQINLNHAKKAGIKTAWVKPLPYEQQQSYTDLVFETTPHFTRYFNHQRRLNIG